MDPYLYLHPWGYLLLLFLIVCIQKLLVEHKSSCFEAGLLPLQIDLGGEPFEADDQLYEFANVEL